MGKFIDEQGRFFGLINLLDLIVIMLLFILGIKILADYRPAPLDLKKTPVTIGLLIRDIPPYLVNSIAVGQDLFADGSNAYLGKIYTVKAISAEIILKNNDRLMISQSPINLDLRLMLKNKARIVTGPARTGVYLGKLAVRVGDKLRAHTLYSSISGEIEYLKVKTNVR